jgi:hypothetical protein
MSNRHPMPPMPAPVLARAARAALAGLAAMLALVALAACQTSRPPTVKFLPYGNDYASKPDFARVERLAPLTVAQRLELTPQNLAVLSQEEIDQIYARLTAGPVPDGPYDGSIIFAKGGGPERISEVLGGLRELVVNLEIEQMKILGETLWKGKVFYRGPMELRNMIDLRGAVATAFGVKEADMRTFQYHDKKVGLLFPAKLFCGQSLLDSRRESIIIDYAFGDDLDGYLDGVDKIAGRNGLQVRDEIRRIRPGFYLGRAYMGRVFVLDFTLFNPQVAAAGLAAWQGGGGNDEDCWPGSPAPRQTAAAAAAAAH